MNNTTPRIPRDHYSVPVTLAVWLALLIAVWSAVALVGRLALWVEPYVLAVLR